MVHSAQPQKSAGALRVGKSVQLQAQSLDAQGAGVCPCSDRLVHVPGLLPDEKADVLIHHESPHTADAWGTVNRRITESPDRVAPACAGYGLCGGCSLQHLRYDAQLRWKTQQLAQSLAWIPGVQDGLRACIAPQADVGDAGSVGAGGLPLGYRSRVKLVAAERSARATEAGSGPLYLGSYVPRSHDVLPMSGCQVNALALSAIAQTLTTELNRLGVRAYHPDRGPGGLRYVLLRESASGEQQLGLVVAERPEAALLSTLTQALTQAHPGLVSVVLHVNRSPGNALLSDEVSEPDGDSADICLHGPAFLWDRVGDLPLRISARSFFQVHRQAAGQIYSDVCALLIRHLGAESAQAGRAPVRLVDVYCGVGGLGLTLLSRIPNSSLVGLEWSASAIADAEASAARLGLSARAEFHRGAAEALGRDSELQARVAATDAVLLNPPRRGCSPDVLSAVAALRPRYVIYVSCSPDSLARDLSTLLSSGYAWVESTPYDMHPGTPHVESVTLLRAVP